MSISTLSFNTSTRTSLLRLQGEVNDLTQQMNNGGRFNDVGRTLGRLTGSAISARAQASTFKEQQTSNGIVSTRLENIDASMETVAEGAESLANNLIGTSVAKDWNTIISQAKSGLQQMTGALNAASSGQYLFGGDKTNALPVATYDTTPASLAKAAAATSFSDFVLAATGGTDPSAVTDVQMTAYLTTGFVDAASVKHQYSDLFSDANWALNWSDASDGISQSPISKTETVTASATANDPSFRTIASAYSMLSDIGLASLGDSARAVVLDLAAKQLKAGSTGITEMRADIGTTLKRIESANTELLRQQDIMTKTVSALEEQDITEVGLRVNALKTQLETAYTVTGKIQNLSLLNYL